MEVNGEMGEKSADGCGVQLARVAEVVETNRARDPIDIASFRAS
jgi:hypothetical protein